MIFTVFFIGKFRYNCDKVSNKRNMESLCEEFRRPNENHEMIKQLLKLTFCLRRKEITAE